MTSVALRHGHPQLRLLSFAIGLVVVAVITLALVGATNPFAITILPALAGLSGFVVEEWSLQREEHGRRPLHHRVRTGLVGSVVFVAALVVATAT